MNGYIKKQSLMDFCDNTASKTIDNNDIARFPVSPVIEIDRVLEIIDGFVNTRFYPDGSVEDHIEDVEGLIYTVLALKGEQE